MPGKYRPGQISTYRNLPERTKHQIKYAATHLGLTRGALIATAMDAFVAKLSTEGHLPEHLSKLVALDHAKRGGDGRVVGPLPAASEAPRCNTPRSPVDDEVERYLKAIAGAAPTEPTAEDVAFEVRLAERRAARNVVMGRVPGGSAG